MWKRIKNSELYLSYYYTDDDAHRLFLTDYLTIWYAFFSKSQFIQCLKESNSKFSKMLENVMLQHACAILLNPNDIKTADVQKENNSIKLSLTKKIAYDFMITVKFSKGSKELFFQKITCPLMTTVHQLNTSQTDLCNLLKEKDIEIDAYKRIDPDMKIPFHERTQKFDAKLYLSKYAGIENFIDSDEILSALLAKNILVPEDAIDMKSENGYQINDVKHVIKVEPESQTVHYESNVEQQSELIIKNEPECTIKSDIVKKEPQVILPSPRKKTRKLNL